MTYSYNPVYANSRAVVLYHLCNLVYQLLARDLVVLQEVQPFLDLCEAFAHVQRVGRHGVLFAHQVRRVLGEFEVPLAVFGLRREVGLAGQEFERLSRQQLLSWVR